MNRYTTSFGLLALLLFAVALTLGSCGGTSAGNEEQESGEQGSKGPPTPASKAWTTRAWVTATLAPMA